jgi:hypothetical protein
MIWGENWVENWGDNFWGLEKCIYICKYRSRVFDPLVGFLIICFNLLYLTNLAGRNPLLVGLKSHAIIKDVLGLSEISMS